MSESKQPPIESDATPVKKSSKKGVTRSSDSSLAASTFSIDNGLQIPRIALAEPKPDTDPKRKASKKRTVTTSRDVDGIAFVGPDASSTIDAAAAKEKEDAERDKQRRREAKRQRAKELEEAKRRQELEKEALEEAQRVHDQRQREARQKEQLEALNANAEECQEDAEDYDDEDFENYDEEFEKEESSPKSTLLPAGKFPLSHTIQDERLNPAMDVAELHRIQQAMQAETRGLESLSSISSRQPSARSDERFEVTKLATTLSSIAGLKQSLDPRAKRVKEIRERRKFEVEKFSLFQMNPMSEHDRVLHRLRRGLIKQAFVQTNDGARALGTQTKAPKTHDKSMHFPDDIGLDVTESASDEVSFTASTSRFFRFLEHASYVCECLAVENVMAVEQEVSDEKLSKSSDQSGLHHRLNKETKLDEKILFPCKREVAMGSLHELIQGRDLVALRFSPVVSSILLSCYGAPRNEAPEPMPKFHTKTISCVWDINRPTDPLHLLLSEGVAASALISPSRDLFVMIGTQDGTIHVWDLRPDSMIQSSTQLADNQAGCTPAYSTCGLNYLAPEQHASTIVALEVMDSSQGSTIDTNGTFQFGSLDDRGVFILWSLIEVKAGDDADKCVQTGGTVKLIMNTRIDLQPQNVPQPPRGSRTTESARSLVPLIGPMATTLKFLPRDINQFVVGMQSGQVVRRSRFDKGSGRMAYQRDQGSGSGDALAGVVCLDFHPFESDYFLVGYEDGRICMYHVDVSVCLSSWEEVAFGVSVCAVAWSTSRPGVFYASYADRTLLVWDLIECTSEPTLSHELTELKNVSSVELASSLYPLVLSSEKMRTSRPAIAWRVDPRVSPFQFSVCELGSGFTTRARTEHQTVASVLAGIL